jgi:hypothetical protein
MLLWLLAADLAGASDGCPRVDESSVRQWDQRAAAALDRDDLVAFDAVLEVVEAGVPCLAVQLPRDAWASLLVSVAVANHSRDEAWQAPLESALRIAPDVDRSRTPPAVREYVPGQSSSNQRRLPEDAAYFLDGVSVSMVGELRGLHVVQRLEGGRWSSRLVQDTPFPADWTEPSSPSSPEPATRGARFHVGLGGGSGATGQVASTSSDFLPTEAIATAVGVAEVGIAIPILGPLGASARSAAPVYLTGYPLALDVTAGLDLSFGTWRLEAGVAAMTVAMTSGAGTQRGMSLQPHLGLAHRWDFGSDVLDVTMGGGWSPLGAHALAEVLYGIDGHGLVGWRIGPIFAWNALTFSELGGARTVQGYRWRAGLTFRTTFDL